MEHTFRERSLARNAELVDLLEELEGLEEMVELEDQGRFCEDGQLDFALCGNHMWEEHFRYAASSC